MNEMTSRERFHAVMGFEPFDRMPMIEWAAWWNKTIERWHGEGLPADVDDRCDLYRYFGLEVYKQHWMHFIHWDGPRPASHGAGVIEDEAGYEEILEYLHCWPVDREKLADWQRQRREEGIVIWLTLPGFFDASRRLLGIERHLYAFYDQPELMHRINTNLADWHVRVIREICEICTPDFMTFMEDMSYNHGPMLGQQQFDEFMAPYYRRVIPELKQRGTWVFIDSDGDITEPASWFDSVGIDGILPLERQAGVDLLELRKSLPQQRYIGAFDKMTMPKGREAMEAEFQRLLPVARQGGFIISVDHQTPPGVSLDNYRTYLDLLGQYAAEAAR
jgi:hypothetical protein